MNTYYVGPEITPPATLHGVRVTTKLYFVIFVEFKESMTLKLALRGHSKSCILATIESQCTVLCRPFIVTLALCSTILEIWTVLYAQS